MKHGCIVGMGAIGPIHAQALGARGWLYAVCDNQPERLTGFAPENAALVRYASFEEVLADAKVDVVHICTPHYLHKDMAIAALAAGKHVVLEKPVAMNPAELEELLTAEANAQTHLCVMLQNRTNPSIVRLREFLETDSSLGKLQGIYGFLTWCRNAAYYTRDPWRGKWATEGGGLLINQAIHTLDLLGYLGGTITKVTGSFSNKTLQNIIEVEDTADAVLETETGLRLHFYGTNGAAYSTPAQLEVKMERGILRYADHRLYKITEDNCEILTYDNQKVPGKDCWGGGHQTVIDGFYHFLETGEGDYITLADAVPAMKTLYAFYNSAKTGKPITLK